MDCDSNNNSLIYTDDQSNNKWQITFTSENCTIKKHCEGWQVCIDKILYSYKICWFTCRGFVIFIKTQICPKSTSDEEKDLRLILTVPKLENNSQCGARKIKTVDAEICCNREDLEELLEAKDKKTDQKDGSIILTEYLQLVKNSETRINLLLKILTKAINEHKCYVICGTFPALKKPLANRGWIEKRAIRKMILMTPDMCEGCNK